MESDEVSRDSAVADLAALQSSRAAMADRLRQPWWYDGALGLLTGGFFASYSLGFPWVPLVALPVFLVGVWLLVNAYRRHTGLWISGFHGGPATRPLIRAWGVLCLVLLTGGLVLQLGFEVRWAMAVTGVVLGVAVALLSHRWTTVYQRELRGQA